jgi:hypothetical protein
MISSSYRLLFGTLTALAVAAAPVRTATAGCETTVLDDRPNDAFSRVGRAYCFASSNPDGSIEVFLADLRGGQPRSLVKDGRRCTGGTRAGQTCGSQRDCPGSDANACETPTLSGCRADAEGRFVYFLFNGNPSGTNPELGDELFRFNTRRGQLAQLTTQAGWCSNDPAKACTTTFDCSPRGGSCRRADLFGLQVSPDGKRVGFAGDGDPGGNPAHGQALFAFAVRGKRNVLSVVRAGSRVCGASSLKRGQACTRDEDCVPDCGDGRVDAPELCDPEVDSVGCSQGQRCSAAGTQNQCTCQTIVCGNGLDEAGEECDGQGQAQCGAGFACGQPGAPGACTCILTARLCGNGVVDGGEECDGGGCGAFQSCVPPGLAGACTCAGNPAVCGNAVLEFGEGCDGAGAPCRPGFQCSAACACEQATACGNGVVEPGEQCDPPGVQGQCAVGLVCGAECRCGP